MILSSVSETLIRILAKMNVGNIPDFLFQCSLILLGSLQFISTVFKKTNQKNPNQTISSEESTKGGAENNQTSRKRIPLMCSYNKICQGKKEKNIFFGWNFVLVSCLKGIFLSSTWWPLMMIFFYKEKKSFSSTSYCHSLFPSLLGRMWYYCLFLTRRVAFDLVYTMVFSPRIFFWVR